MNELSGAAEARSKTWWLLSQFFLERPEIGFLAELRELFATQESEAGEDERLLARSLEDGDGDLARRLGVEYTRLFRGIQQGYGPPPPYESLHKGDQLMGEAALAVRRRYEAAGFGDVAPSAGPPDHLGAELRFLSLAGFREMEAWMAGDRDQAQLRRTQQREFLDQHLLTWLPAYAESISLESREPYYRAAVGLTAGFAESCRQELEPSEPEWEAA